MIVRKRLVSVSWPGKRQFRTCGPKQAHATFYLLVEDFDRADAEGSINPEDTNRLPGPIPRRQDALFNSAVALLSSAHTRPGRYGFFPAETRMRENRNSAYLCTHWHTPICQVSGHLGRNDQNSAGRYPLISRPMHTSTSVGVVHNMSALPLWL
jgi:hypothetical protein